MVLETPIGDDNRIHMMPGDALDISVTGAVDTVQWRSNHLRDDWSTLSAYSQGAEGVSLDLSTIVTQLQSLPASPPTETTPSRFEAAANDSGGHSSTSNIAVNVMLMDTQIANNVQTASSGGGISAGVISALVVVVLGLTGCCSGRPQRARRW